MIPPPPTSIPFPTRSSSDLRDIAVRREIPRGILRAHARIVRGVRRERANGNTGHIANRSAGISGDREAERDRKSTRLNSSHLGISYAVFCLKKKKKKNEKSD